MSKLWIILLIVAMVGICGCSDDETTTVTDGDTTVTTSTPEGAEDQWCPVGTTVTSSNPQTGEMMEMEVVGTEEVEGITMCKAVMEINDPQEGVATIEYFWAEDEESFVWNAYDESGDLMSSMKLINGKMTMTDAEGNVMDINAP